ncbi:MAG: lipopolysaccharide biosynthesis protein [Deltaproteobacteria bacterium]|nr:lipopolysaccharide biosynthesis protein [Deltaproteobacteria bacterium]
MTNPLSSQASSAVRWRTAQLIGVNAIFLIRVLVLARILAPDAFGLFAIALVPIGILLQASELGMIPALVHAREPTQRHYDVAWTIGLARGLVTAGLVVALAPWVAEFAGEPRAASITRVLALQPLLLAISSIRVAELQRQLKFRPLAIIHLGEAMANTIAAVALAPLIGVWALVAGMLAGNLLRLVISYIVAPYAPRVAFNAGAARSLVRFGQWVFVAALTSTIGGALLRLLISRQLGAAELGIYYLATRLTFLLGGTVIDVGSSVAFPIYARLQEEREEAIRVFRAVWSATMALIVPAFALFIALAPSIVTDVLGAQWQGTEAVLRILAGVCILSIFGDVTGPIWQGMGQPWRNALIEALQSAVLLIGVWLLASRLGVIGAALAWIPAVLVTQLVSAIFLPRVLSRPMRGLSSTALAVVTSALVGAATALLIDRAVDGLPGTIAAAVAGGLVALAGLWFGDRRFDLGLVHSLQRVFPRLPWPGSLGNDARD